MDDIKTLAVMDNMLLFVVGLMTLLTVVMLGAGIRLWQARRHKSQYQQAQHSVTVEVD